ncbi:hypothetical protein T05_2962 [Trichinella murrelli]|uniref:Uncharacterized protein n=1 Tax=Trichinella murrelli TaxID=144512 RepID=A0A0V0TI47_9BILA|nr:hypothetical protein T05_2962 [Trichinella murrelli]
MVFSFFVCFEAIKFNKASSACLCKWARSRGFPSGPGAEDCSSFWKVSSEINVKYAIHNGKKAKATDMVASFSKI